MRALIADAFPEHYLADLRALGLDVAYEPSATAEQLPERAKGANILVVRSTKVTREVIVGGKALGLVLRAGAGYDTIDVAAASERGIFVANCPGKNAVAVAELAFGLMIALDRRVADNTADLRAGVWNKKEYSKADGLKGKTLGVIGLGSIGCAVVERARAFEMNVLAWSRSLTGTRADELGVGYCRTPDEVAERADIVTVHLAQTKETKGMFGATFFSKMKRRSMFINTSRGGLHDEAALVAAMRDRGLRAGLDVFESEPAAPTATDVNNEIFKMPGFVGTHHIGASTEQAQDAIAAEAVRICREYLATGKPPNVVNVEVKAPAKSELVVRHYDKVGVLAQVLGIIRNHGINVADMTNTIFQGSKAAVASIRITSEPASDLIREISQLEDMVIQVEAKRL
ncbi:MAG: hydroxyacid dehydrogenase [Polyangiaceae bacterium]|jgi:D-3-phosphoglycerate dehydrogenase|nr:hydroxyacid dehydrogenase [Polyangiaceae bacterium]MBK8940746.1 hydroxyacid dehydrogenase [Polyangiaceae bacterium]